MEWKQGGEQPSIWKTVPEENTKSGRKVFESKFEINIFTDKFLILVKQICRSNLIFLAGSLFPVFFGEEPMTSKSFNKNLMNLLVIKANANWMVDHNVSNEKFIAFIIYLKA